MALRQWESFFDFGFIRNGFSNKKNFLNTIAGIAGMRAGAHFAYNFNVASYSMWLSVEHVFRIRRRIDWRHTDYYDF